MSRKIDEITNAAKESSDSRSPELQKKIEELQTKVEELEDENKSLADLRLWYQEEEYEDEYDEGE